MHQIVTAALRSQQGQCASCGKTRHQTELTVRRAARSGEGILYGFAPWNLRTVCYACDAESDSDGDDAESEADADADDFCSEVDR